MARSTSQRLRAITSQTGRGSLPPGREPDVEGPVSLPVFVMAALVGFLVVLGVGVFFGLRTIESDLETRTLALLEAAGQKDIEVEASGRDIYLSGTVGEDRLVARVPEFVATRLEGVRTVTANLRVVITNEAREIVIAAEPLVVTWTPTTASVTGTISDEPTLASITDALSKVFPQIDTTGLTVDPGVASERDWLPSVLTLVREMSELTLEGQILANPNASVVTVSAEFEARQERGDVRRTVEDVLAGITFDFVSGLTVKDAEPPPPVERVVTLQETLDELIEADDPIEFKIVEFETGSDRITPVGRELLDEILVILKTFPAVAIEIAGHTDDTGSDENNLLLSRGRAEAVLAYLVDSGQDPGRFVVIGYGETRPIADNETADGRARNRRIEFTALEE